ncbi:hypothetical protein SUDANB1_00138 [Streptomyces sp. enrichment culture]
MTTVITTLGLLIAGLGQALGRVRPRASPYWNDGSHRR